MKTSPLAQAGMSLALIVSLGFGSVALAQDQTVTGNLSVEGDLDLSGNTLSLGTRADSSVIPGASVIYNDATSPIIDFSATRSAATWLWQSGINTPQLQLDGANTLSLFDPATGAIGIVLNPAGTSTLAGGLTVNGPLSAPSSYQLDGQTVLSINPAGTTLLIGQGLPSANVGIGTDSPAARLTVSGTSTSGADAVVNFTDANATSLLLVNNAGNVGIGTSSPAAKLQVAGDLYAGASLTSNEIRFYGTSEDGDGNFGNTVIAERLYAGSDRSELLLFKGNDLDTSAAPGTAWGDRIRLDTPGSIVFQTGGGYRSYAPSTEGVTVMTLNSAGRVLVGALADDGESKFQVSGNVRINGVLRVPAAGDLSMGGFTTGANPAAQ